MPPVIPVYQYGLVFTAAQQDGGGAIVFVNVHMDRDPYGSYMKDLLDKGWEVEKESENDQV